MSSLANYGLTSRDFAPQGTIHVWLPETLPRRTQKKRPTRSFWRI